MGFLGLSFTSDLRKEQYRVECLKKDLELLKISFKKKLEDETKYLKEESREKTDLILNYGKELKEFKERIEEVKTQKEQLSGHITSINRDNEILTKQIKAFSKKMKMCEEIVKYLFGCVDKKNRDDVKAELAKKWGLQLDFDPDKVEEPEEEKVEKESIMDKDDIVTSSIVVPEKPKKKASPKKKTPKKQ